MTFCQTQQTLLVLVYINVVNSTQLSDVLLFRSVLYSFNALINFILLFISTFDVFMYCVFTCIINYESNYLRKIKAYIYIVHVLFSDILFLLLLCQI